MRRYAVNRATLTELPVQLPGRVYVGADTITADSTQSRYIHRSVWPAGNGELARQWLTNQRRTLDLPRLCRSSRDRANSDIPPALHFDGISRDGDWEMIDIAACYYTLLRAWPLDLSYHHARSIDGGRPVVGWGHAPLPAEQAALMSDHKDVRNAAFGVLRATRMAWMENGRWHHQDAITPLSAPGLTGLILACVHAIAREAVERFGAVMWLTDAGIFPRGRGAAFSEWLRREWLLEATVKAAGPGHLYGIGSYHIGRRRTRTPEVNTAAMTSLLELPPGYGSRLQEKRRTWAVDNAV